MELPGGSVLKGFGEPIWGRDLSGGLTLGGMCDWERLLRGWGRGPWWLLERVRVQADAGIYARQREAGMCQMLWSRQGGGRAKGSRDDFVDS